MEPNSEAEIDGLGIPTIYSMLGSIKCHSRSLNRPLWTKVREILAAERDRAGSRMLEFIENPAK